MQFYKNTTLLLTYITYVIPWPTPSLLICMRLSFQILGHESRIIYYLHHPTTPVFSLLMCLASYLLDAWIFLDGHSAAFLLPVSSINFDLLRSMKLTYALVLFFLLHNTLYEFIYGLPDVMMTLEYLVHQVIDTVSNLADKLSQLLLSRSAITYGVFCGVIFVFAIWGAWVWCFTNFYNKCFKAPMAGGTCVRW